MSKCVLITTSSFEVDQSPSLTTLSNQGFNFVLNPFKRKLTSDEASMLLAKHRPVGMIAGVESLGQAQLASCPELKVISRCGTGLDTVDLDAAKKSGITVMNTPDAPAPSVAELALGLILCCLRQIPQADRGIRNNAWNPIKGRLLSGKVVGIVGFGRIGRNLAQLLSGFDVRIMAYDPNLQASQIGTGIELATLQDLLEKADILTLHLPYSAEAHHILGRNSIASMKKGAILINVARGGLVDEAALHDAIVEGHLAAAGLDVFESEPYSGLLANLAQVVMTAHMGTSARETRNIMEEEAAANLLQYLVKNGLTLK